MIQVWRTEYRRDDDITYILDEVDADRMEITQGSYGILLLFKGTDTNPIAVFSDWSSANISE